MIRVLSPADYRQQRWKNGGGVTHEIAADADAIPPAWRISIATIERDGPFSDFPGYDRTIVALDGGSVELSIDDETVLLRRHEPYDFRGEAAVTCRLHGGAARDLNVMTKRSAFAHDVEVITSAQRFLVDDDELIFAYVLAGDATVADAVCTVGETVYVDGIERFDVTPSHGGVICLTRITPR